MSGNQIIIFCWKVLHKVSIAIKQKFPRGIYSIKIRQRRQEAECANERRPERNKLEVWLLQRDRERAMPIPTYSTEYGRNKTTTTLERFMTAAGLSKLGRFHITYKDFIAKT